MNYIPRGWVPVDGMEMTEDRGWDLDEIERRIRVGNLYDIINTQWFFGTGEYGGRKR